jgi:hypothetical protein
MAKQTKSEVSASGDEAPDGAALARTHLKLGWWMVLIYLSLGIGLEALHGLKVDWYLNVANETRRLMFTLAHSHGALIGLLHLGFAYTASTLAAPPSKLASMCLTASGLLLPGGFLLGGLVVHGGDPGKGILLVPVGAALLLFAVLQTALRATKK